MKVAIWARSTGARGRNVASLKPAMIPSAAASLMLSSWTLESSSAKASGLAVGRAKPATWSRMLSTKVASWPRVTSRPVP